MPKFIAVWYLSLNYKGVSNVASGLNYLLEDLNSTDPIPNSLSRVIFEGEVTLSFLKIMSCVASEIELHSTQIRNISMEHANWK